MTNYLDKSILEEPIENIVDNRERTAPLASIIIVTHKTRKQTIISIIDKLKNSSDHPFEILLIDNNKKSDLIEIAHKEELIYIKLKENYGITTGRNIGIINARGETLIFLDDDALPGERFINEHIKAHRNYKICALRGKCLPLTNSVFNHFAEHYNLGDEIFPYPVNLEGNSSFSRDILIKVGGFNSLLKGAAGHEGIELSNRIIEETRNTKSIIYYPGAIIHHDYSRTLLHYLKKLLRHEDKEYIMNNYSGPSDLLAPIVYKDKENTNKLDLSTKIKIRLIQKTCHYLLKLNSIAKKMKTAGKDKTLAD